MLASWCSTRPPFRQHNNEGGNERQEQHQLVGHDEAPSQEGGACRQAGSSPSFVANSAKTTSKPRCTNGAAGGWFDGGGLAGRPQHALRTATLKERTSTSASPSPNELLRDWFLCRHSDEVSNPLKSGPGEKAPLSDAGAE